MVHPPIAKRSASILRSGAHGIAARARLATTISIPSNKSTCFCETTHTLQHQTVERLTFSGRVVIEWRYLEPVCEESSSEGTNNSSDRVEHLRKREVFDVAVDVVT